MIDAARNRVAKAAAAGLVQLDDRARLDVDARFWLHRLSIHEQKPQAAVVPPAEPARGQARARAEERRIDDGAGVVAQRNDLPGAALELAGAAAVGSDFLAQDADPGVFLPYLHGNSDHV